MRITVEPNQGMLIIFEPEFDLVKVVTLTHAWMFTLQQFSELMQRVTEKKSE